MTVSEMDIRVAQLARIAADGLVDFANAVENGDELTDQHDEFLKWMDGTTELFRSHVRGAQYIQRLRETMKNRTKDEVTE